MSISSYKGHLYLFSYEPSIHIFCSFFCLVMSMTVVEFFISWEDKFMVIPVTQSISQVVFHLLILHVANLGQNTVRR